MFEGLHEYILCVCFVLFLKQKSNIELVEGKGSFLLLPAVTVNNLM